MPLWGHLYYSLLFFFFPESDAINILVNIFCTSIIFSNNLLKVMFLNEHFMFNFPSRKFEVAYISFRLHEGILASTSSLPDLNNTESLKSFKCLYQIEKWKWYTILILILIFIIRASKHSLIFNGYLFFLLWELLMYINWLCVVKGLISQRPPGTNVKADRIRFIDMMKQEKVLQRNYRMLCDKREQGIIFCSVWLLWMILKSV